MLLNTTIEGLKTLRLDAMAATWAEQHEQAAYSGLGFEERLCELHASSHSEIALAFLIAYSSRRPPSGSARPARQCSCARHSYPGGKSPDLLLPMPRANARSSAST